MKPENRSYGTLLATLICVLTVWTRADAQKIESNPESARVTVRNVTVNNQVVSGEVVNNSPHTVRDIELLLQYHWLWKNEFKPRDDSPGTVVSVPLQKELRSGESTPFTYTPQPSLPARPDGQFMVEVSVASFAEIIPQKSSTGDSSRR
jgi:hypothetical protein